MNKTDISHMQEAIHWASLCNPIHEAIPKVGAIIAIGEEVISRGRRGTGSLGDDEHAEFDALERVKHKTRLPDATLYTTLEPCTGEVRTRPLECCTELILQHGIRRVVIGILDPNQGVTGKGLWRLQNSGVDVSLFPHDLAVQVKALNPAFIRFQQTLGATIVSPETNGEELHTYLTEGRHPVRFTSVNPPTNENFLLCVKNGLCWPQSSVFRPIEPANTWEVDAHFGATGAHTLHLITATALGITLITYYRRVIDRNRSRKRALQAILRQGHELLREGDWPGIPMNAIPKGLRSESSVTVTIVAAPK